MRKIHRVHFGKDPHSFHSYRDFDNQSDALAHLWAMANIPRFERVWYWQGLDGWLTNNHLKGKIYPESLKQKIQALISEDNLIMGAVYD
jgi:hypothetical protein